MNSPRRARTVALLQLPIPDPDPALRGANVPLAGGCLKAALPPEQREAVRILPRELARHAGDTVILDWLAGLEPDLAGFSCYLWNLERSLWLASRLKERLPSARVVLGGPEIVEGRALLAGPQADAFVQGEGETVFAGLLEALETGALPRFTRAPLARLEQTPNPYCAGALEARADEPLYLETLRGCPHRCSYCFYGKQFPSVRRFPGEVLPAAFALARERGVPEVYLMDPSFTSAAGLERRLARLAACNPTGIPLHAELRLEAVSPQAARLMREAGFASVEAGLQSVNPRALAAVGRSFQAEAFLRGAGLLQAQGIRIRTGLILGLPGDGLEGFAASLRFLKQHGLAAGAEVYPLAVLPGTRLRGEAAGLGLDHMPQPPYWVLRAPGWSESDLFRGVRLAGEELGGEMFAPLVPGFADPAPGLTGCLDLRGGSPAASLASLELLERAVRDPASLRLAGCLTVVVSAAQLAGAAALDELRRLGARLLGANPFTLFQLVIDSPEIPPLEPALHLAEAFHEPGGYFDRSRYYQEDLQGRFSSRLYHLTADLDAARRHFAEALPLELILAWTPRLLAAGRDLLEEHPILLVDRPLGPAAEGELRRIYEGFPGLLLLRPYAERSSSAMKP